MRRDAALLALLGLGAALYLAYQDSARAAIDYSPIFPEDATMPQDAGTGAEATAPTLDSRVAAMLATIREFESGGNYSILFGGRLFDGFADHPRTRIWFYDARRAGPRGAPNNYTTAAGAYQFLSTTWDTLARRLRLPDFSPESQDAAAAEYLRELGAVDALARDDVAGAFNLASRAWASLPGSTAMQNPKSMAAALDAYNSALV